jgi:hypothetical protein
MRFQNSTNGWNALTLVRCERVSGFSDERNLGPLPGFIGFSKIRHATLGSRPGQETAGDITPQIRAFFRDCGGRARPLSHTQAVLAG